MTELHDTVWIEKYRPRDFENLVLEEKANIIKYLENPKSIPSFIFYSSKPGTGKTTTAKLIIDILKCDSICLNASDERGIETIREKIKLFSRSLSSNNQVKRCAFLDEADFLTSQAANSLRNLMEEYSDNVFFIFTANSLEKIIEPIRSRCQVINFEKPDKTAILVRLQEIVSNENLSASDDELNILIESCYPDIRSMVQRLQKLNIDGKSISEDVTGYEQFFELMKKKNIKEIYNTVYSGEFNFQGFNKWLFHKTFESCSTESFDKTRFIALKLADTEKSWSAGANLEIGFIANILEICNKL